MPIIKTITLPGGQTAPDAHIVVDAVHVCPDHIGWTLAAYADAQDAARDPLVRFRLAEYRLFVPRPFAPLEEMLDGVDAMLAGTYRAQAPADMAAHDWSVEAWQGNGDALQTVLVAEDQTTTHKVVPRLAAPAMAAQVDGALSAILAALEAETLDRPHWSEASAA